MITLRSTPRRLAKLVSRINAVAMAADGAEGVLVEVFRKLVADGMSQDEAYTLTQTGVPWAACQTVSRLPKTGLHSWFVLVYKHDSGSCAAWQNRPITVVITASCDDDFRLICETRRFRGNSTTDFCAATFKDLRV